MQTDYAIDMKVAMNEGQLVDSGFHDIVDGKNSLSAVRQGSVVLLGASDGLIIKPAATFAKAAIKGVVVAPSVMEQTSESDPVYLEDSVVPCLRKGRIWVKVASNVSQGGAVWVTHSGSNAGKFGGSDPGMSTGTDVSAMGFQWVTTATSGNYAQLEVNL